MLPFSWMDYNFMKNALLAILIITPLFGILGTMIVNNRMAFFSDALGHSALTGIAIGTLFGLGNTNIAMVVFAIIFALLLNMINRKNTVSTDTVISVFSSLSMSIGLVILSRGGNFSKYSGLLVGDILSITVNEIGYLVIIFAGTMVFWLFGFNKLLGAGVNTTLARS
ncbi:MAG: metal ABC transporter permease, partial [Clostridiales bacterium]|nr:metal ABC transporter permease [Clostridiales bacterium]